VNQFALLRFSMNDHSVNYQLFRDVDGTDWITSIQLRAADLDYLGHVTAAAYLVFFEEARTRWLAECWGHPDPPYVVARQQIEYLRELLLEEAEITIRIRLARIGCSSLDVVEQLEVRGGEPKARSEARLVVWDTATRSSRPLTSEERLALLAQAPD
jgi:acyl-CoA thioester hydrolase